MKNTEYQITLTAPQLHGMADVLSQGPFRVVAPILASIEKQILEADAAAVKTEPTAKKSGDA